MQIPYVTDKLLLADVSSAYGGTLDFELKQVPSSQCDSDDVVMVRAGLRLAFDTPYNPRVDCTSYSVVLHESGGWQRNSMEGPLAIRAELLTVLSNLEALRIRGLFDGWPNIVGLDNVVLNGGPGAP